jgi:hypothetical protein
MRDDGMIVHKQATHTRAIMICREFFKKFDFRKKKTHFEHLLKEIRMIITSCNIFIYIEKKLLHE